MVQLEQSEHLKQPLDIADLRHGASIQENPAGFLIKKELQWEQWLTWEFIKQI